MAKEKKEKKPKSKARKIIEWVFTGIFLALFAVVGLAQIDGLVNKKNHYDCTTIECPDMARHEPAGR